MLRVRTISGYGQRGLRVARAGVQRPVGKPGVIKGVAML